MITLLLLITVLATISQALAVQRMFRYVEKELSFLPASETPKVSVILPCKGLDPGFEENIHKLLLQDYKDPITGRPAFEVIFATATDQDPAYLALQRLCATPPDVPVQLVVAGTSTVRAQKVNNQLAALARVSTESEILVFVDSDVIARPDFLRYLVAHLDDPAVGVTTGYRFYIPFKGDWPSLIRSLWNRMTAWELASPRYAFAWGGAMACRRETFARAKILQSWELSADDDLALTTAIKALGLQVRFVPQCLVASHGDATLGEVMEWTNRQLVLTKVYYPELWWRAIQKAVVLAIWLLAVCFSCLCGLVTGDHNCLQAGAVGLSLPAIELLFLFRAQPLWERVLSSNNAAQIARKQNENARGHSRSALGHEPSIEEAYDRSLLRFSMVLPLAHLILPWITLNSLLTNRITWRGITYELRSRTETVII